MRAGAKGSLYVHARRFVYQHGGEAKWRELMAALSESDRRTIDEPMISNGWYPVELWNRLMRAFLASDGGPALIQLSRYIAAEDLSIIFKMLLKMGSPEFVLKRTEAIYLRYFDSGRFGAIEEGPRRWKLTLDAPKEEEEGPGEAVCTFGVPGWLTEALVRTGAKAVRIDHVRCRFQGAPHCVFQATW